MGIAYSQQASASPPPLSVPMPPGHAGCAGSPGAGRTVPAATREQARFFRAVLLWEGMLRRVLVPLRAGRRNTVWSTSALAALPPLFGLGRRSAREQLVKQHRVEPQSAGHIFAGHRPLRLAGGNFVRDPILIPAPALRGT